MAASSGTERGSSTARDGRVARVEPRITSAKPIPMPRLKASWRTGTPRTAATAGLTYVMTVARTGPISSMRAANRRKAAARGHPDHLGRLRSNVTGAIFADFAAGG
jgi:hypothetical protein